MPLFSFFEVYVANKAVIDASIEQAAKQSAAKMGTLFSQVFKRNPG